MRDGDRNAVQQAESDEALLVVEKAVVFEGEGRTGEHLLGIDEIDAVIFEVT